MTYVAPTYPRVKFEDDARRKLSKDDIAEIKSLHQQGFSFKRIGNLMGVSAHTAHYHSDPEWARQQNKKRYQELKKKHAQETPEERKQRYYEQNQRFLERTKSDPAAAEFKAKHTYKWKKSKLSTDPVFKEKTNKQSRDKYYRDMETQPEVLRERWRRSRLKKTAKKGNSKS